MSLLNAWVTPTEAIVAVDTDGAAGDGSRYPASKLMPIPHLNAVIALRGQCALIGFLTLRAMSSGFHAFDDLDDEMPSILEGMDGAMPPDLIVPTGLSGVELVTVGWSQRRRAMLGRQYVKRGDDLEYARRDLGIHVSPWNQTMQGTKTTAGAVLPLAKAQVRWMREAFPNAACGGNLLVARVSRNRVDIRIEASLEG